MSDKKLTLKTYIVKLRVYVEKFRKYSFAAFLVFIALIYGFVLFRINTLGNSQPTDSDVSNQVKASQTPHIDQSVVKQLESLKDNSVSVQALFDQARSNP